jgi:multimeric flavodoxin WrbA
MKATIVVGSAREVGNTELQSQSVADALKDSGIKVDIIRPARMDILHCNGCNKCIGDNECCLKDDMQAIYDAYRDSDLFIIATPVYFSGPSSIITQVIDRFQCFWASVDEPMTEKYVALLSNGGSRNPRFENIISICRAFAFGIRANWAGECLADSTDDSDISHVAKPAYKFGLELAEKLKGHI